MFHPKARYSQMNFDSAHTFSSGLSSLILLQLQELAVEFSVYKTCFARVVAETVALRLEAIEHARKRDGFADMLQPADPCHAALDAHAEAAVRYAAEFAQ